MIDCIKTAIAKKQAGVNRMHLRQLKAHQRIADFVETNPQVLSQGLERVLLYLRQPNHPSREIYLEWRQLLENSSHLDIISILRDTSPDTEQLRTTAPFCSSMG